MKDSKVGGGRPLTVITLEVQNIDDCLECVTQNGRSIVEPKTAIPGVGWYATGAEPGGLPFGMIQFDPNIK